MNTSAGMESIFGAGETTNMYGQVLPLAGVNYDRFGQKGTVAGFDTVVVAIGTQPENALAEELKGLDIPVHVIGDAKQARKIIDATAKAAEVARNI